MRISHLVLVVFFIGQNVQAQKCDGSAPSGYIFPRVFLGMYQRRSNYLEEFEVTEATFRWALGSCGKTLEVAVQKMFRFFEFSYGVDMSAVKASPFKNYNDSQMSFSPAAHHPDGEIDTLVTEAFYEYVQYRNTPLIYAGWYVVANTTFTGVKGTLQPGQLMSYGFMRFKVDDHDFCMEIYHRVPSSSAGGQGMRPMDYEVYNEVWGKGAFLGVHIDHDGVVNQSYMISFPSEPPKDV